MAMLQWSRFFSKRKIGRKNPAAPGRLKLQWSRFFSKRKIAPGARRQIGAVEKLQWSRFFSKRKIGVFTDARYKVFTGFNGAAFFQSGKCDALENCLWWHLSFNGAAFFQSGKCRVPPIAGDVHQGFNGAAFFQSGKCKKRAVRVNEAGLLQWSRFFSKRKMRLPRNASCASNGRFNGAAFFQSGKYSDKQEDRNQAKRLQWSRFFSKRKISPYAPITRVRAPELQWSRFFSKRKIGSRLSASDRERTASMEPLFFKAENTCRPGKSLKALMLQWSRFFSKRKIYNFNGFYPAIWNSFNGAAFFQSGKSQTGFWLFLYFKGFNGAAFFQSGKLFLHFSIRFVKGASMEPLFFKAENRRQPCAGAR